MRIAPLFATLAIISSPLYAHEIGPWGEPHLSPQPRSQAEAERIKAATAAPTTFDEPSAFETRSAGAATQMAPQPGTLFSSPLPTLSDDKKLDFSLGEAMFEKLWVQAPSSTVSSDGLGPLYNTRACSACHINDGRGFVASPDDHKGLVLRLSVPATGMQPEPNYGFQLQTRAIAGHESEGRLGIVYEEQPVELGDGATITLRAPRYSVQDGTFGDLAAGTMTSPRIAPQMIGLGLLEAIPEADILALADPMDADGDGISGRPNVVWSREFDQNMLGRFGHKAGNPTLRQQSADAANGDIGLSSTLFPAHSGDCTERQKNCIHERHGGTEAQDGVELGNKALDVLTTYAATLAPPARRDVSNPEVLRGKALFYQSGCTGCHTPAFVTHRLPDDPARSFQLIWPYSDMLLHDMGEGLADRRPEWQASGQEWRTPPLWGIGLTGQVSGHSTFLHDGRARSLLEAILWHGGEAEAARETVRLMDASDRAALITFLESL
ncbi:di-heme oxidoredictase family protein [Aliiroseovarius sp. F20344]|uniref:di-heme oxidoreductase family protein n=1 Tax=Aliiroseovarius sp. F20344 TaxID=2926414 RepID=UPI001FF5EB89|nr:di-heme oxidoredictase family protein [Aliiroseovarius sp. F20344]MCK0141884.1 c-type cytochrome [Aliiroseovarius sp. F20344]